MALIEKIRSKGTLIVIVIGISLLLFLIGANPEMVFGGGAPDAGEVAGQTISNGEWIKAVEERKPLFNYSGNDQSLINDTWNQLVEDKMYADEFEATGIQVTEEALDAIMFGKYISPYVNTTIYQGQATDTMKTQMRANFDGMEDERSGPWRKLITKKRQKEVYDNMVKKGAYANKLDGKWSFKMTNDRAAIDYVVKLYSEIPDSTITVNDDDVRAYYNKHKNEREYRNAEESRTLDYISFPVVASAEDSADIRNQINILMPQFRTAKTDSAFAIANAATPANAVSRYTAGTLMEPFNSQILSDSIGKVVGPYIEGTSLKIAKVIKRGSEVDSVQARHILIKDPSPAGKAKADSIKNVIAASKNFEAMAAMFGTDGTKDKGGDLGMFGRGAMVKPFEEACFSGAVGVLQVVNTNFGWHVVEVTKKGAPKSYSEIAVIDRMFEPSPKTVKSAYTSAKDFTLNNSDSIAFRTAAGHLNGGTRIVSAKGIRINATSISGLNNAGNLVNWAYAAELGEVSQPELIENQYIIAVLKEVKEKGVPSFENVAEVMRKKVLNEKKAESIKSNLTDGTLEERAARIGAEVKKGENITMSSRNIPGSGASLAENELIGTIFGLATGATSSVIVGESGVYVFRRSADVAPGTTTDDYLSNQTSTTQTIQSRILNGINNAFKEAAEIEDNRYKRD
jgi:peptidyl-prolyl cis-trans isomerase D